MHFPGAQAQLQHQLALQHHQQLLTSSLAAGGGAGGDASVQHLLFQRLAASAAQHTDPRQGEAAPAVAWPDDWPEAPTDA